MAELESLSLVDLAGYLDGRTSCAVSVRVAAFKKVRQLVEGDPRVVADVGMPDVLEALRCTITAAASPWAGKALKVLCTVVCCDGVDIVAADERAKIAACLKRTVAHDDAEAAAAAALVLSVPGLRGGSDAGGQEELGVYVAVLRALLLPLPPKSPRHLQAAIRALSRVLLDPAGERRAASTLHLWLPYCVHLLAFDGSDAEDGGGGGGGGSSVAGEYAAGQRDVLDTLGVLLRRIPVSAVPNGEAAKHLNAALRQRRGFMTACLERKSSARAAGESEEEAAAAAAAAALQVEKGLVLWAVQARLDGTIRDKSFRHEAEVNTLLTTMTGMLASSQHVDRCLWAWRHLVASWTFNPAFLKKKYALILCHPLARKRVWLGAPETRELGCKTWLFLIASAARRIAVTAPPASPPPTPSRGQPPPPPPPAAAATAAASHFSEYVAIIAAAFLDAVVPLRRGEVNVAGPPPSCVTVEEGTLSLATLLELLYDGGGGGGGGSAAADPSCEAGRRATYLSWRTLQERLTGADCQHLAAVHGGSAAEEAEAAAKADDVLGAFVSGRSMMNEPSTIGGGPAAAASAAAGSTSELRREAGVLLGLLADASPGKGREAPRSFVDVPELLRAWKDDLDTAYFVADGGAGAGAALPLHAAASSFGAAEGGVRPRTQDVVLTLAEQTVRGLTSAVEGGGADLSALLLRVWFAGKLMSSAEFAAAASAPEPPLAGAEDAPRRRADAVLQRVAAVAAALPRLALASEGGPRRSRLRRLQIARYALCLLSPFFPLGLPLHCAAAKLPYGKLLFVGVAEALAAPRPPAAASASTADAAAEAAEERFLMRIAVAGLVCERRKAATRLQTLLYATEQLALLVLQGSRPSAADTEAAAEKRSEEEGEEAAPRRPQAPTAALVLWELLADEVMSLFVDENIATQGKKVGGDGGGLPGDAYHSVTSFLCKKKHFEPLLAFFVTLPLLLLARTQEGGGGDDESREEEEEYVRLLLAKQLFGVTLLEGAYRGVRAHQQGSPVACEPAVTGHGTLHTQGCNVHTVLQPWSAYLQSAFVHQARHNLSPRRRLAVSAAFVSAACRVPAAAAAAAASTASQTALPRMPFADVAAEAVARVEAVRVHGLLYSDVTNAEDGGGGGDACRGGGGAATACRAFEAFAASYVDAAEAVASERLVHLPHDTVVPGRTQAAAAASAQGFAHVVRTELLQANGASAPHALVLALCANAAECLTGLLFVDGAFSVDKVAANSGAALQAVRLLQDCMCGRPVEDSGGAPPAVRPPVWGLPAFERAGPASGAHCAAVAFAFARACPALAEAARRCREVSLPRSGAVAAAAAPEVELRCRALQEAVGEAMRRVCTCLEESKGVRQLLERRRQEGAVPAAARASPVVEGLTAAAMAAAVEEKARGSRSDDGVGLLAVFFGVSQVVSAAVGCGSVTVAGSGVRLWEETYGALNDSEAVAAGLLYSRSLVSALHAASKAACRVVRVPGLPSDASAAATATATDTTSGDVVGAQPKAEESHSSRSGGVAAASTEATLERPLSPTLQLPTESQTVLPATPPQPTGGGGLLHRHAFSRGRPSVATTPVHCVTVDLPPPTPRTKVAAEADEAEPETPPLRLRQKQTPQRPPASRGSLKRKRHEDDSSSAIESPPRKAARVEDLLTEKSDGSFCYGEGDEPFFAALEGCPDPVYALLEGMGVVGGGVSMLPSSLWVSSSGSPEDVSCVGDLAGMKSSRAKKLLKSPQLVARLMKKHLESIEMKEEAQRQAEEESRRNAAIYGVPTDSAGAAVAAGAEEEEEEVLAEGEDDGIVMAVDDDDADAAADDGGDGAASDDVASARSGAASQQSPAAARPQAKVTFVTPGRARKTRYRGAVLCDSESGGDGEDGDDASSQPILENALPTVTSAQEPRSSGAMADAEADEEQRAAQGEWDGDEWWAASRRSLAAAIGPCNEVTMRQRMLLYGRICSELAPLLLGSAVPVPAVSGEDIPLLQVPAPATTAVPPAPARMPALRQTADTQFEESVAPFAPLPTLHGGTFPPSGP